MKIIKIISQIQGINKLLCRLENYKIKNDKIKRDNIEHCKGHNRQI